MSGTRSIFDVAELFDSVLFLVDIRTILVSGQRVCKQWRELINKSPLLQQHLFLVPSPFQGTWSPENVRPHPRRRINPLLQELFPELVPRDSDSDLQEDDEIDSNGDDSQATPRAISRYNANAKDLYSSMPLYMRRSEEDSPLHRDGATWKDMLVAQPPFMVVARYGPQDEEPLVEGEFDEGEWDDPSTNVIQFVAPHSLACTVLAELQPIQRCGINIFRRQC